MNEEELDEHAYRKLSVRAININTQKRFNSPSEVQPVKMKKTVTSGATSKVVTSR